MTVESSQVVELSSDALLQVLEGAPDAIVLADAKGTLRFANRQTEVMFGYARGELLGKPIEVLVPSAQRAAHGALRERYMVAPAARPMGVQSALFAQRKNGETFAVEVSLSPITTADGRFVAGAVRDVTERKRQEAAEALANQRLLSAVESSQTMFALFDAEDRLVLCNSAFRQLFEQASGPAVERRFCELLDGARKLFADEVRTRWLSYHAHPERTIDLNMADGRVLRVAERATAEGGRVTTVWNVSEDAARERELQLARAAAEAASAAKSDFLSSMSHELRTPMNAILGFTQLIAGDRREPPSERQRERLGQVLRAGQHLLRLIEDALDLSRIEAGRLSVSLEEVPVHYVMQQVASSLASLAQQHAVTIQEPTEAAAGLCVRADQTRLFQILANYATNAIKYGRSGGYVRFSATPGAPGRVIVRVEDGGPGISEANQASLFEPFQRAGQERGPIEGTGIGLTICKRLAELMGGSVGVESQLGRGACFWVELSASEQVRGAQTLPARARPLDTATETKRRILYIEDNPSNLAVMSDLVQELEHVELCAATTAEQGIELATAHPPNLILMDINLPGISGWEAARRLKANPRTEKIPLVALSAAAYTPGSIEPDPMPFAHYLTKPVGLDDLLQTLEDLLASA